MKKSLSTRRKKTGLDVIIERLSSDAVDTQILLDRIHLEQTARYIHDLKHAGVALDDPIAQNLMPCGFRVQSQTITVNIMQSQSRSTRAGLDVILGGRIVSTFFEAAYGHAEKQYDRLKIELTAEPIDQHSNRKD